MQFGEVGFCEWVADTLKIDVENQSVADNPMRFSMRVKPSNLGDECVARRWYEFRWVLKKKVNGRIARLMQRGTREENKTADLMRKLGWHIDEIDPERAHKYIKQFKLDYMNGHLIGFLDGIASHPVYTNGTKILHEYKTYNTKRFCLVAQKGVKLTDLEYYVQMCIYMKFYELPWCLFVAINKNDDDIYFEIVARNDGIADHYLKAAEAIITSPVRPARYAESEAHHVCKACDYVGICHRGEPVEINCRSCLLCEPVADGNFRCKQWQAIIPGREAMLAACPNHTPVK